MANVLGMGDHLYQVILDCVSTTISSLTIGASETKEDVMSFEEGVIRRLVTWSFHHHEFQLVCRMTQGSVDYKYRVRGPETGGSWFWLREHAEFRRFTTALKNKARNGL